MRLIDSNRLYDIAATKHGMFHVADVDILPVIDAVPVIRCKDCISWGFGKIGEPEYAKTCAYAQWIVGANDYCSNAMVKYDENQID
jgi:ribosomal protein L3